MRLSRIKDDGSVAVLMAIVLPLFAVMLAVVIEMGRIALARARLQVAADRAASAGAAVAADAFNRVAAANWKIHKAWRDLARDFQADSQQNQEAAAQRFARYEAERDAAFDEIDAALDAAPARAQAMAGRVLLANAPHAAGDVTSRLEASLADDADRSLQWGRPGYGYVTGPVFTDPESYEGGAFDALKFLIKIPGPDSSVGVFASQTVQPLLLKRILGDGVEVRAAAASQAFGGSIDGFARRETETVEEAEAEVADDGTDGLYRAALVPMWTLGPAGAGMVH